MAQIMNFKRMEVTGATKEEALSYAPFGIQGDATQAYRNARKAHIGAWTDADMKQFMLDYLTKKSKNLPGVGFYITEESAVVNTRERCYKIEDIKSEGPRKTGKVYQLIDAATNQVLAETEAKMVPQTDKEGNVLKDEEGNTRMKVSSETKVAAKEMAKDLIVNKGFRGKGYARLTKQVVEGEDKVFTFEYTPSKNAKAGRYILFGIENA